MFRVIDKLAKLLESVLLDLATVRQKINKGKLHDNLGVVKLKRIITYFFHQYVKNEFGRWKANWKRLRFNI